MPEQQIVFGFFDNVAEAQQAVQLLLARGFTHETVALSTIVLATDVGMAVTDGFLNDRIAVFGGETSPYFAHDF